MSETTRASTVRSAREVLAWSRDLTRPGLRSAVETLPPSMRRVAGYHFGWLDEHGLPAAVGGGKAVRPALVLLAAEAAGGSAAAALPAAVAVELVHNFSLLHDDVMDGDATRRHRRTAWSVFGVNAAILAGDALLTLAFDVLRADGRPAVPEAARVLGAAVLDLVEGQSADTSFERRDDVTLPECVSMAESKTGALLGAACTLGGLFGGGGPERVERLRRFGDRLGLAFQLVDDLLGIWGDPAVTGKPVYSDLRNRKKSLPVVAALTSGTPAARELAAFYRRHHPAAAPGLPNLASAPGLPPTGAGPADTDAGLMRAAGLVEAAGGREWTQEHADALLAEALAHLASLDRPAPRATAELRALAHLVAHRDH
ncbi:family 2 encapsulin nanocompartment cargo protein polyprenyl transferase [Sphaerisporangium perillae]|uniref:family 2 encapsulin nanocompartment cargo protein polyprenyl transferase n=1 Tax=Sphaerisporangium perillae TaxID=2935860 RepID=UPI00200FA614|nr:family 2 encapsulin nanocompartment cargo protein polyprenyl transferase [Sphaerisporangium perillae]